MEDKRYTWYFDNGDGALMAWEHGNDLEILKFNATEAAGPGATAFRQVIRSNKSGKILFDSKPPIKVKSIAKSSKKRKVFVSGDVALVNVGGFYYGGMFTGYNVGHNDEAWIEFPMPNQGWTHLLCVKAKNAPHWNPIK